MPRAPIQRSDRSGPGGRCRSPSCIHDVFRLLGDARRLSWEMPNLTAQTGHGGSAHADPGRPNRAQHTRPRAEGALCGDARSLPPSLSDLVTTEVLKASWDTVIAREGPVTAAGAPLSEPTADRARGGESPGHLRARRVHPGCVGGRGRPAAGSPPRSPGRRETDRAVGGAGLRRPGHVRRGRGHVELARLRGTRNDQRAARVSMSPGLVLLAGSGPLVRDKTMGGTSRSRTSPGAWPRGSSPCSASTR